MSNKEAVKILKKKLDTCTRATEQALKKKDYKAVEKSMRTAFVFMKAHSALKKQIPQKLVILADKNACSCSVCGNIINDCLAPIVQNADRRLTGRIVKCLLQKVMKSKTFWLAIVN